MHVGPLEQPSSNAWWSTAALFPSLQMKHKWEFLLHGKSGSEMVERARSSKKKKKKSSISFSYLSHLCLTHVFNKDHTHTVLWEGYLLFLLACSFKPPSCSYYCFRTTILHREALSEEKLHGFSWAEGRLKPPVLVPLPAFPLRDFFFLSTVSAGLLQEIKPPRSAPLGLAGSCGFSCCRRRWLCRFLLPAPAVRGRLHQEETLKPAVGAAAVATGQSWLLGGVIQRKGEVPRKACPAVQQTQALPGKIEGFQSFWNPKGFSSTFLQVERLGSHLTEPFSCPPSPPTADSVQKACVQLGKANFKAV